jgi:dihydrolipoamide dehydrogenase
VSAIRAAQLGLKTAVIEKQYWGGVCLNVGCIPSKALIRNADIAHILNHDAKTFGISGDNISMDYTVAHKRSRKVSSGIVKGVHFLMKKNKITEINGVGSFTDANTVEITDGDDAGKQVTFDNAIIASGSVVKSLPGVEIGGNIVSYEEQILDENAPKSMVVIGAGAIGMEFAYVLSNFGVDITVVEFMDRVLPNEDKDVSKEIAKQYKKLGVNLKTGHKTTAVRDLGGDKGVEVDIESADGSKSETVKADRVMVSIGFAPRVEGFGLDNTGVKLTERGAIDIDERMRTNVPHIYAIGDVTAKLQLAHVAEAQGVVAAETIAGAETQELGDYMNMPRATFCNPQVASFGYTEEAPQAGRGGRTRDQGRDLPVQRERQGHGTQRGRRFRQDHRGRRVRRADRWTPGRPGRLRAVAGADPGAALRPDRRGDRTQRPHPPDPVGGHQGGRRGHDGAHDQPLAPPSGGYFLCQREKSHLKRFPHREKRRSQACGARPEIDRGVIFSFSESAAAWSAGQSGVSNDQTPVRRGTIFATPPDR